MKIDYDTKTVTMTLEELECLDGESAWAGIAGNFSGLYASMREAIKTIDRLHNLDDAAYAVRDYAIGEEDGWDEDNWDHPDVQEYAEALDKLRVLLKNPLAITIS